MNVMPKNKLYIFLSINILERSGRHIGLLLFLYSILDFHMTQIYSATYFEILNVISF